MSLKNLVLLRGFKDTYDSWQLSGGSKDTYDSCKKKVMENIMHEYKHNKLKDRAKHKIKRQDQAIAIGLSKVEDTCLYNKDDVIKLLDKVHNDLNNKEKELILTNIVETKHALIELMKLRKSKKIYIYKKLLWDKIIKSGLKGESLNKNMWDEIKQINDL